MENVLEIKIIVKLNYHAQTMDSDVLIKLVELHKQHVDQK